MIQANDLRIGNYLGYIVNDKFVVGKVTGIINAEDSIRIIVDYHYPGHVIGRYLPLTPEILKKAGFKKEKKSKHYETHIGFIHKNENGLDDQFSDDMDAYIFNVWYKEGYGTHQAIAELKYVHQLQNLFFALTGNELSISL